MSPEVLLAALGARPELQPGRDEARDDDDRVLGLVPLFPQLYSRSLEVAVPAAAKVARTFIGRIRSCTNVCPKPR